MVEKMVFAPEGVFTESGMSVKGHKEALYTGLSVAYINTGAEFRAGSPQKRAKSVLEYCYGSSVKTRATIPVSKRWTAVVAENISQGETGVVFETYAHRQSVRHLYYATMELRKSSPAVDFERLARVSLKTKSVFDPNLGLTRVSAAYNSSRGGRSYMKDVDCDSGLDLSGGYVVHWSKRRYHRAVCEDVNLKTTGLWEEALGKNSGIVAGWSVLLGIAPCEKCNPMGLDSR